MNFPLLAKLGVGSFVAGAGLEFVLQVSGYNKLLEEGAERRRLAAELDQKEIEERLVKKYGKEKVNEMTKTGDKHS